MCNELNVPLARIRSNADREELAEKWNELSTYDVGMHKNFKMIRINFYVNILLKYLLNKQSH